MEPVVGHLGSNWDHGHPYIMRILHIFWSETQNTRNPDPIQTTGCHSEVPYQSTITTKVWRGCQFSMIAVVCILLSEKLIRVKEIWSLRGSPSRDPTQQIYSRRIDFMEWRWNWHSGPDSADLLTESRLYGVELVLTQRAWLSRFTHGE